jgi:hypothetical protein
MLKFVIEEYDSQGIKLWRVTDRNGLYAEGLTWGEMIEQVIGVTHPQIQEARYRRIAPNAHNIKGGK